MVLPQNGPDNRGGYPFFFFDRSKLKSRDKYT